MPRQRQKPTEQQRSLAAFLEIDISEDSQEVAAARIREAVEPAINPSKGYRSPTQNQIDLAHQLGLDISGDSFWVCFAKINEHLRDLHQKAHERLQLKPGDWVKQTQTFDHEGIKHTTEKKYQVSSIGNDGKVYFRKGGGFSAWPSQLEKIEDEE